eukprot:gene6304-4525_t
MLRSTVMSLRFAQNATCRRAVNPLLTAKFFSTNDDSHDDFKPKRKEFKDGMDEVVKLVEKQVKEHPVMLYMKGTPQQPQCGFSLQAVRILNAVGVDFSSVNVLEYPAIREGVKLYSEWPTLPQLYVAGEFVGGCDIMTSMYNDGQLQTLLKEKKLVE